MPADMKADETLVNDAELENGDTIFSQDDQPKPDATQLYLGEIGFSPLLTAEEEVYFARRSLKGCEASRKRMIVATSLLLRLLAVITTVGWHFCFNRRRQFRTYSCRREV